MKDKIVREACTPEIMKDARKRAEKVWARIVAAGETGDDMAVDWIEEAIMQHFVESVSNTITKKGG